MRRRRRADTFRPGHLPLGREEELVELEAVLPHGEVDRVLAGFLDVQVDLIRLAAVLLVRALLALPAPGVLPFAPLKALTGGGPLAVEPHMQPVVLAPRGVRPDPDVVPPGGLDEHLVVQDHHLPGLRAEVLSPGQLVAVGPTRVREDLHVGATAGARHMGGIPVGFDVRSVVPGRQVEGPFLGGRLLEEVLRLHGHEAILLEEHHILRDHGGGGIPQSRKRQRQQRSEPDSKNTRTQRWVTHERITCSEGCSSGTDSLGAESAHGAHGTQRVCPEPCGCAAGRGGDRSSGQK